MPETIESANELLVSALDCCKQIKRFRNHSAEYHKYMTWLAEMQGSEDPDWMNLVPDETKAKLDQWWTELDRNYKEAKDRLGGLSILMSEPSRLTWGVDTLPLLRAAEGKPNRERFDLAFATAMQVVHVASGALADAQMNQRHSIPRHRSTNFNRSWKTLLHKNKRKNKKRNPYAQ